MWEKRAFISGPPVTRLTHLQGREGGGGGLEGLHEGGARHFQARVLSLSPSFPLPPLTHAARYLGGAADDAVAEPAEREVVVLCLGARGAVGLGVGEQREHLVAGGGSGGRE